MFKKSNITYLSRFAIIAAISYCIPVVFFLRNEEYSQSWLLYLGNAIFLACLFIYGIIYAPRETAPVKYNGFTVTILGVIFSCIFVFLLILIFAPGIFNIGASKEALQQAPPAISNSGHHGILFLLFADATIGNVAAGTFAAVLTRSKVEENKLPG